MCFCLLQTNVGFEMFRRMMASQEILEQLRLLSFPVSYNRQTIPLFYMASKTFGGYVTLRETLLDNGPFNESQTYS